MLPAVLSALGVLGALVWIAFFVQAGRHRRWVKYLKDQPDREPAGGWPALAVVFAARDEAADVERAARSLLAADYPDLRVIAVDDRSTDGTGAILDRLAGEDPRLTVVHVTELPAGWLGKTHALERGAAGAEADADWLLFTDADVVFAPGVLRRAVAFAEATGAGHVTVPPTIPTQTLGERLFLAMFQTGLTLHSPGWRVEDDAARAAVGIGAFNLVRAEAFRAIGGFRRLRLSVDDDMQLGRALKWSGRRSRVLLGADAVSVRWHVGMGGMIRGLEKNFFAGARFRLPVAAGYVGAIYLVGAAPLVGLFVGPAWARGICALGVAVTALMLELMGRQSGIRWYHAPLMPVGAAACALAVLRSTWVTLRQRGIRWRGHFYALRDLRGHLRGRERWMRELWLSTR